MNNKKFMIIDGLPVAIEGEKNILDVIRKAGIDLPTLCYYSALSTYGACRMCVVEGKNGDIMASCSTPPRSGMEIKTNTPRLQKYRKMILELMLSDHCRECTTCEKNFDCKLQELAQRFGLKDVRFDQYSIDDTRDDSSPAIMRNPNKCIICGDCVRMCSEIQNVGAIDFAYRGSKMEVTTAFNMPISETNCVNCGQCAAICPTGAITIKNDLQPLWDDLHDKDTIVVAQIAPAVRVALGDEFGIPRGTNVMGKIVSALRRMGFDEVYDTATGADLTVIEEANELVGRLEKGEKLPLFTSCCPAWFRYAEINHPELMDNISSCKSPMEMFGSVLKERAKLNEKGKKPKKTKVVAIMPCTAKKYEIHREEFQYDGEPTIAHSITTMELANMIREAGLRFEDILPEAVDMPFGIASGAGVIFGVTGGVTEAVIRYVMGDAAREHLADISFTGVRGFEGLKEVKVPYKDRELNIAIVSGLKNAENLIQAIQAGEVEYDFVEVMACEGGCIAGAGQPFVIGRAKPERSEGMYQADRMSNVKLSAENPVTDGLYASLLVGDKAHHLLHYK
ncbi:MAG: [FeFe] hydrogenase, group A [Clostridiales Family XIII bacterium]|uniref:[FeFe] hydrogenase, group A n=1 Tax=Hominibacterium faecale TaxID=2839743 RepID=UPI0011DE4942|nr:[FeFe] hydrogenase, group A [Hominibacterium faecale]MCI7301660.1 [FeFe] hydrogenase, group A [Clostridia bacterium]MDE8731866.1 [FeFe] hydrogenase, group A [Eubacteriales bacterium DFI.9.88]MDY3013306.1 [FeFe] hydrogenase, group A [Clostridiales Family XIII bacterium]